jgi:hypothetical protein
MTNVFSSIIFCLVIELKGKWSIRPRRRFHSTPSVFAGIPHCSPLWYNLHSYLFICHWRESKRAYISLTSIRFWRLMPKGRKYEPKAKGPHHHRILKNKVFKIDILLCSKGEKVVSSKLAKPS